MLKSFKFKILFLFLLGAIFSAFFIRCIENSITLYVGSPETLKKDKIASFYGTQAKKNCELYRRLYAGFCDTTGHPFISCFDLNEKKYKLASCD